MRSDHEASLCELSKMPSLTKGRIEVGLPLCFAVLEEGGFNTSPRIPLLGKEGRRAGSKGTGSPFSEGGWGAFSSSGFTRSRRRRT